MKTTSDGKQSVLTLIRVKITPRTCSLLADDVSRAKLEVLAVQQLDVPEAAGELRDV